MCVQFSVCTLSECRQRRPAARTRPRQQNLQSRSVRQGRPASHAGAGRLDCAASPALHTQGDTTHACTHLQTHTWHAAQANAPPPGHAGMMPWAQGCATHSLTSAQHAAHPHNTHTTYTHSRQQHPHKPVCTSVCSCHLRGGGGAARVESCARAGVAAGQAGSQRQAQAGSSSVRVVGGIRDGAVTRRACVACRCH